MMPKTLYRYSQEQRKQKPADILATDSGFQSNEVYLTFVQNLMKKGKKSTAENLFRKTAVDFLPFFIKFWTKVK